MELESRKKFIKKISFVLISISSIILINFLIDPFQQYRIPYFYKLGNLREEERYLNAGLIRNKRYDSILIGSSITRNFDEEYLKKTLDWNIVKLTMSDANQEEIKFVLEHVNMSKVKNIIISIDIGAFKERKSEIKIPKYLYKEKLSLKDSYIYLTNIGILKQSFKLVYYNLKYNKNIEEKFKLGYEYTYSKKEVLKNQKIKNIPLNYEIDLKDCPVRMIENFNKTLKIILEKNNTKNIILFFPPYSIITYKNMVAEKSIQEYLALKFFLVNTISNYSNVKIYDFQDIESITHNLNNYGDKLHYSPEVSKKLVDYIAEDCYRITPENVIKRIENLKKQLN